MNLSADPPCYGLGSGASGTVDAANIGRAFLLRFPAEISPSAEGKRESATARPVLSEVGLPLDPGGP